MQRHENTISQSLQLSLMFETEYELTEEHHQKYNGSETGENAQKQRNTRTYKVLKSYNFVGIKFSS